MIDLRSPNMIQNHVKNLNEFEYLNGITENKDLLTLFKKLVPYFNSEYSIREITWRENLSQEELEEVLKIFKSVLFVYEI